MPSLTTEIVVERRVASVPGARARVRDTLRRWGTDAQTVEDIALLVTELVNNAVRHAGGTRVAVYLACQHDRVRCDVLDESPTLPPTHSAPVLPLESAGGTVGDIDLVMPESGRGLCLVAALATRWGSHTDTHTGWSRKTVWFECDLVSHDRELPRRERRPVDPDRPVQVVTPVDPVLLRRVLVGLRHL